MVTQDKSVQLKLSLLKLAGEIGSVSKACAMMNFSRDSYYRFKGLYLQGGEEALKSVNRRKPLLKNRVSKKVEFEVRELALSHPGYGQQKASAALREKAIMVSPSGVRSIWIRHDLETQCKRAQALRSMVLQDGLVPDDEQQTAMRATPRSSRPDALEAGGPGYLCFHGLKYLGNVGGIGPVFLQIFQDCYSRHAFIRLSNSKDEPEAGEFLKQHVLPWFAQRQTPIKTIRSDRTTTFCGRGKHNDYQNLLQGQGIEQCFQASRRHEPNEPWITFYQTIKDEFFRFAIPSRADWKLADLQQAADEWVSFHNRCRPNTARFCYGKTPLNTFIDARSAILATSPADKLPGPGVRRSSG